ncbi:MAG TPA: RluA family pseudouridine synthase [Candidatus Acidoferrales bacterium]|nr:RluA family pseudouridine synthase [Candidatus Acidoferrales bacterium]
MRWDEITPEDEEVLPLESSQQVRLIVASENSGERLDRFLGAHLGEMSRTRLQALIDRGQVRVDGVARKRSHRVEAGETLIVQIPSPRPVQTKPEAIPLEILYEDDDVVVVNKPAGLVVHPGAGVKSGTLVNALLHKYGSGGKLSSVGGELRPGIVHRLDKETSGALLVARNDAAHRALSEQFASRQIEKTYIALLHGKISGESGRIELPVARDLHRRTRMTTRRREGRPARTDWILRLRFPGFSLVEASLHTGRTHQIRVHFSALGHPVVGDTLYGAPRNPKVGAKSLEPLGRNFLHAARLRFLHPHTKTEIEVRAPLPRKLIDYLQAIARAAGAEEQSVDAALKPYL